MIPSQLHIAESVVGKAGVPNLARFIPTGNIDILLNTLRCKGTDGTEIKLTAVIDGFRKPQNILGTARRIAEYGFPPCPRSFLRNQTTMRRH